MGPLLLALTLLAEPATRTADGEEHAQARRHFEEAEGHFRRGAHARALVAYEAGYRLSRLPGFLLNIAQCHRLMGDLRKARAHYRKYLLVMPASPRREEIEEVVLSIDRVLASDGGGGAGRVAAPRTPSLRWWLWSALAGSVVGGTVATMALDRAAPPPR